MKDKKEPTSTATMVRNKTPIQNYLKAKAKANPNNPHNYVATEIQALIAADFEKNGHRFQRQR